jgi:two-component system sensor histidine kinase KdpD
MEPRSTDHAAFPRTGWLGADVPAGRDRTWRAYAWGLGLVALGTLLDKTVFAHLRETNLVMVYLVATLAVALRGDRGAAIATAVGSVLVYDFFFVPPYNSFSVSDSEYLFSLAAMGLIGLVISSLTARLAAEVTMTRFRERQSRALFELSRSLLAAGTPTEIVAEGARVIGVELGETLGAWTADAWGEPVAATPPAVPLNPSEHELLRWVLHEGRAAGRDTPRLPGSAYLFVPIGVKGRVHGAIALHLPPEHPLPEGPWRSALETGANLLAIALDRTRSQQDAVEAQRRADSERVRNALLSSVSHDLRTPLTGIIGSAGTLIDSADAMPPEVRLELAQSILEEAERLSRLVTNLLQATRLDAGEVALAASWFTLDEVLAPVLARLGPMLEAHPVSVSLPSELPMVYGDPTLIELVLMNLLENAAKHTPAGTPIRVRAWSDGGRIGVEVHDEGRGLPPGEEVRVFEKFRRYPTATGAAGAGLGLAICRGVIEAHGGAITAGRGSAGGAVFRFSLPVKGRTADPIRPLLQ